MTKKKVKQDAIVEGNPHPLDEEEMEDCGCGDDKDCECVEVETAIARKKKPSYDSYTRYDAVAFSSKPKKTSQGFLQVSANLSRTGVFTYHLPDGSVRRELRLPEEVFNTKALDTAKASPVTLDHPREAGKNVLVKPKNAKKFSVGVLASDIRTDERIMGGDLIVMDEEAISEVETGNRTQISMGYTCDLEIKSGTWKGEKYDAIQRNIIYNHIALVKKGRAGDEVCIRMDSKDAQTEYPENEEKKMELVTIKLDGVDVEISKQAATAFEAVKAELEKTKGQLDAIKADLATAEKARTDAEDPARVHGAVLARVNLINKAQKVLGKDFDASVLTDRQIKEETLKKANPEMKFDGASDDYINGYFDHAVESHRERNDSAAAVRKVVEETAKNPANSPSAVTDKVKQMWSGSWKQTK